MKQKEEEWEDDDSSFSSSFNCEYFDDMQGVCVLPCCNLGDGALVFFFFGSSFFFF